MLGCKRWKPCYIPTHPPLLVAFGIALNKIDINKNMHSHMNPRTHCMTCRSKVAMAKSNVHNATLLQLWCYVSLISLAAPPCIQPTLRFTLVSCFLTYHGGVP